MLRCVVLSCLVLRCVALCCVVLCCVVLCCVVESCLCMTSLFPIYFHFYGIQASGVEAPYDEDISTPHEKALGKTSRTKSLSDGANEREREKERRERGKTERENRERIR